MRMVSMCSCLPRQSSNSSICAHMSILFKINFILYHLKIVAHWVRKRLSKSNLVCSGGWSCFVSLRSPWEIDPAEFFRQFWRRDLFCFGSRGESWLLVSGKPKHEGRWIFRIRTLKTYHRSSTTPNNPNGPMRNFLSWIVSAFNDRRFKQRRFDFAQKDQIWNCLDSNQCPNFPSTNKILDRKISGLAK